MFFCQGMLLDTNLLRHTLVTMTYAEETAPASGMQIDVGPRRSF